MTVEEAADSAIPDEFIGDGCSWWPDRFFWVDCTALCRQHDWFYHLIRMNYQEWGYAATLRFKQFADNRLRMGLEAKVHETFPSFVANWYAWIMWQGVKQFGGLALWR